MIDDNEAVHSPEKESHTSQQLEDPHEEVKEDVPQFGNAEIEFFHDMLG